MVPVSSNAHPKHWAGLISLFFLFILDSSLLHADTFALVIGINEYENFGKLDGAVNDANDVAAALQQYKARKIIKLLDKDATRDRIMAAWKSIITMAKPGDTLFLHYAGHGAQQPERIPGSEPTGKDSFWLMSGFAASGPATYERILDDEIAVMLKAAKPLQVVMISDSCHSGTMTRGKNSLRKLKTRAAPFQRIQDDALPKPTTTLKPVSEADLAHVTFFGAVPDTEEVPEVTIDKQQRGALSWAVAKAFRGEADLDRDGQVTKGELERFIRESVRMATDGLQHPQATIRTRTGVLLSFNAEENARETTTSEKMAQEAERIPVKPNADRISLATIMPPTLKLFMKADPAGEGTRAFVRISPESVAEGKVSPPASTFNPDTTLLKGIHVVRSEEPGAWMLDQVSGRIYSPLGDVFHSLKKGGSAADHAVTLNQVFGKIKLVERIKELSRHTEPLAIALQPNDRLHHLGELLTFSVANLKYAHFTLINLGSDGTINFLYPHTESPYNDPLTVKTNKPYELPLKVQPPLGGDHFVAITSQKPLVDLHRELKALDGQTNTVQLANTLEKHLTSSLVYQTGVHGVFTGE
ncbi:MAG: caspase family protein [Magnetococcus sp. DMHC-1]|nr:caspase family protein [Magnetococcales bacterium]MBF0154086.1 caspase family protein [Magnetococcales bacterium]